MRQKSIEQKKLEGTYRACVDAPREEAEALVASVGVFYPAGTRLRAPKTIRTSAGRKHWREVTRNCMRLGMLSPVDLPQVERLCLYYEKLEEIASLFLAARPTEEEYKPLLDSLLKLAKAYDALADKYYVSPQARSRLALDALNVTKAAQDVRAADDGIGQLLARR